MILATHQIIAQSFAKDTVLKNNDSLLTRSTAFVAAGCIVEGASIITQYPIPYFGLGHFLQKRWESGIIYSVTESMLLFIEHSLRGKITPADFVRYPYISTSTIFLSGKGLSPQSNAYYSYAELIRHTAYYFRMIDFFDAYKTLHNERAVYNKVKFYNSSIPDLVISPFKPKYLSSPWVFVPIVITGVAAYLSSSSDKPLSSAAEVTIFNKTFSPSRAALFLSAINAFRYLMVASGEEMFFRGVVQTELTERFDPTIALITTSVLFGLWHIPNNGVSGGLISAAAGLYLGYRYNANGYDLGEVIAAHFWLDWLPSVVELIRNPKESRFIYSISWKL